MCKIELKKIAKSQSWKSRETELASGPLELAQRPRQPQRSSSKINAEEGNTASDRWDCAATAEESPGSFGTKTSDRWLMASGLLGKRSARFQPQFFSKTFQP
ncbi:hypothetical protein AAHA92_10347 [Salvia divinorum]|uniref:Uncharacterized protein n=1 Tax=Salvia divinorum TaxID=28513 RepID=A0ABD1HUC4_SALDI